MPALALPRMSSAAQTYVDAGLAAALGAIGQLLLWSGAVDEGSLAVTCPSYLVMSAAIAARRRRPIVMAALVAAAWLTQSLLAITPTSLWALVVILMATFSVGAYAEDPASYIAGAGLMLVTYAGAWLNPAGQLGDRLFTAPVLCGGPWLAGRLVRRHRVQASALAEVNEELERRRADDVRTATAEERARIARELHDVVAHGISVIIVQAGAASRVLEQDPAAARQPLEHIRTTAKAALGEMRHLLGVLRTDNDAQLAPLPGLADLPALVTQMRSTGLQAELHMPDCLPALAPGCELAAYRIVQESLTNTLKHAGAVPVCVSLACDNETLNIRVHDAGTRRPGADGVGHGIIGMRERARIYGGSVEADRSADGGWTVAVSLPLDGTARA